MAPTRPILVINPRDDEAFSRRVAALIDGGADTPSALAAALRGDYPQVTVRERGLSSEPQVMWYIYRDGHWVP